MTPGIHTLTNDEYQASAGASKSKLWKLYKTTPFHARFSDDAETEAQKFGTASHTAVLEPNNFEPTYVRGPADRRGNKWTAACEIAQAAGKICLTEDDYDDALRLRDVLHRDADIRKLTAGAPAIEQSAYWIDPATGELMRCRPDIFNHDIKVMADLKSTTSAAAWDFSKKCEEFGYMTQEAIYTEGWTAAGGGPVDAFLFIAVERKAPHAYKLYELSPAAVLEGHAVYRQALESYHACMTLERDVCERYKTPGPDRDDLLRDCWPMYGQGVDELDLPAYGYRLTRRESNGE